MTGPARATVPPALRCRCVCVMTHAMPGRDPSVVCAGRIVVFVEMTNRAVRDVPMCQPCADYAATQPGFVQTRPMPI